MFHPLNMAAMDVNALRRLCTASHNMGRRKLRAYMAVLEGGDLFPQECFKLRAVSCHSLYSLRRFIPRGYSSSIAQLISSNSAWTYSAQLYWCIYSPR